MNLWVAAYRTASQAPITSSEGNAWDELLMGILLGMAIRAVLLQVLYTFPRDRKHEVVEVV